LIKSYKNEKMKKNKNIKKYFLCASVSLCPKNMPKLEIRFQDFCRNLLNS